MKTRQFKPSLSLTLIGGLLAGAVTAGAQMDREQSGGEPQLVIPQQEQAAERPDNAARMETLRERYETLSERLGEVHQKAMREEDLLEAVKDYEKMVGKKILEIAPDLKEEVEENAKLTKKLREAGDVEELDTSELQEYQHHVMRQQELRQQLAPVETQLQTNEKIQEVRMELHDKLFAQMREIEPGTEEMIQERVALMQELNQMQQQMMQRQQQQQQAPGQQRGAQPQQGQQAPQQGQQPPRQGQQPPR